MELDVSSDDEVVQEMVEVLRNLVVVSTFRSHQLVAQARTTVEAARFIMAEMKHWFGPARPLANIVDLTNVHDKSADKV